jgi:hypothetical protein
MAAATAESMTFDWARALAAKQRTSRRTRAFTFGEAGEGRIKVYLHRGTRKPGRATLRVSVGAQNEAGYTPAMQGPAFSGPDNAVNVSVGGKDVRVWTVAPTASASPSATRDNGARWVIAFDGEEHIGPIADPDSRMEDVVRMVNAWWRERPK